MSALRQAAIVAHPAEPRTTAVDRSLAVLRQVVSDLGHTYESLGAAMRKDRSYIHKVLSGEKPMPADFIDALPDDVEAEWHARRAKAFGRVVVSPVHGAEALAAFVGGLVGLLAPQLPVKADRMLKVGLREGDER